MFRAILCIISRKISTQLFCKIFWQVVFFLLIHSNSLLYSGSFFTVIRVTNQHASFFVLQIQTLKKGCFKQTQRVETIGQASVLGTEMVMWPTSAGPGALEWVTSQLPTTADLWCLPLQVEQEDFVMEGHGKTPPPGEESKQ